MEPRMLISRALKPTAVYEYGALYGHALIACLMGSPTTISRIGWCDNETHTRDSNLACTGNIEYAASKLAALVRTHASTTTLDSLTFAPCRPELVLVDSDHLEASAGYDALCALQMQPLCILFDDWTANHPGVECAINKLYNHLLRQNRDAHVRRVPTVNGIGVLALSYQVMHAISSLLNQHGVPLLPVEWGEHAP